MKKLFLFIAPLCCFCLYGYNNTDSSDSIICSQQLQHECVVPSDTLDSIDVQIVIDSTSYDVDNSNK